MTHKIPKYIHNKILQQNKLLHKASLITEEIIAWYKAQIGDNDDIADEEYEEISFDGVSYLIEENIESNLRKCCNEGE